MINPATEEPIATIALGGAEDVDAAVAAAQGARSRPSRRRPREERLALLEQHHRRLPGAHTTSWPTIISQEMGAPLWLAQAAQAAAGLGHLATARSVLDDFEFEEEHGHDADRARADRRLRR